MYSDSLGVLVVFECFWYLVAEGCRELQNMFLRWGDRCLAVFGLRTWSHVLRAGTRSRNFVSYCLCLQKYQGFSERTTFGQRVDMCRS